jgi:hypothetical protein
MCVSCLILELNRNQSFWDSDYGAEEGKKILTGTLWRRKFSFDLTIEFC